MKKESVVAIIPAYNEEKTVASVVRVVKACPLIQEVIVVSDGSTDHTAEVAKKAGARVIVLKQNIGKGGAMRKGLSKTQASVILFLDADLIQITKQHISLLIQPVLSREKEMQVGIWDRGKIIASVVHRFPLISGLRAVRREVLEAIPKKYFQGFMVEAAMNYYCRSRHLSYGSLDLKGLHIRHKYQKVDFLTAVVQYLIMAGEIIAAMVIVRVARLKGQF